MRELVPGHQYELDCLKSKTRIKFKFFRDPALHKIGWVGPSTQEVLRMCIARTKSLNAELPWWGNHLIITFLRGAIFLFEIRAIFRKAKKANGIENAKTGPDGHI